MNVGGQASPAKKAWIGWVIGDRPEGAGHRSGPARDGSGWARSQPITDPPPARIVGCFLPAGPLDPEGTPGWSTRSLHLAGVGGGSWPGSAAVPREKHRHGDYHVIAASSWGRPPSPPRPVPVRSYTAIARDNVVVMAAALARGGQRIAHYPATRTGGIRQRHRI